MNVKKSLAYLTMVGVLCGVMTSKAEVPDTRIVESNKAVAAYRELWENVRADLETQENSPSREIFRLLLKEEKTMRSIVLHSIKYFEQRKNYYDSLLNVLMCRGFDNPRDLLMQIRDLQEICQRAGTFLEEKDIRKILGERDAFDVAQEKWKAQFGSLIRGL